MGRADQIGRPLICSIATRNRVSNEPARDPEFRQVALARNVWRGGERGVVFGTFTGFFATNPASTAKCPPECARRAAAASPAASVDHSQALGDTAIAAPCEARAGPDKAAAR